MPNTRQIVQYEYFILRKHYKVKRGDDFLLSMQEIAIFSEEELVKKHIEAFEENQQEVKKELLNINLSYTSCWADKPLEEMNFNLPIDPEYIPIKKGKEKVKLEAGTIINQEQE